MGIDTKEKTARNTSVGADERQSIHNNAVDSIPTFGAEINDSLENPAESPEEAYRKMQCLNDPAYA